MQKQYSKPKLFSILLLLCFVSAPAIAKSGFLKTRQQDKLSVTIEIIADSSNTITASVTVEAGANARDLMEKLFQIDYADRGKKFINGIAGFQTRRFKREYWALEVDGEYSKLGIAEIVLQRNTKIVWRLASY